MLARTVVVCCFWARPRPTITRNLPELRRGRRTLAAGRSPCSTATGNVFAWRGDSSAAPSTPHGQSDLSQAPSSPPRMAVLPGIWAVSPPGHRHARSESTWSEGRGPLTGHGGSTITQQVAKLMCLGVPYEQHSGKTRPSTNRMATARPCGARSRKCPSRWRWSFAYTKDEILSVLHEPRLPEGAGTTRLRGRGAAPISPPPRPT